MKTAGEFIQHTAQRQECRQEMIKNNMKEQLCLMKDILRGSNDWLLGVPEGDKRDVREIKCEKIYIYWLTVIRTEGRYEFSEIQGGLISVKS